MYSWDAPNNDYELSVGLVISNVQIADGGDYICSASVTDSNDSVYVVDSDPATDIVNIISKNSLLHTCTCTQFSQTMHHPL